MKSGWNIVNSVERAADSREEVVMPYKRFLCLLLPLFLGGCSSKPPPETVWVGQLLPLEGANRTLAQHARQGVELAVAEARRRSDHRRASLRRPPRR